MARHGLALACAVLLVCMVVSESSAASGERSRGAVAVAVGSAILGVGAAVTILGCWGAATDDIGLGSVLYPVIGVGVALDVAGLIVLFRGIERHNAALTAEESWQEDRPRERRKARAH